MLVFKLFFQALRVLSLLSLKGGMSFKSVAKTKCPKSERVGTFSFSNRLNDIIPFFTDNWLNENEPNIKINLKPKIQETVC